MCTKKKTHFKSECRLGAYCMNTGIYTMNENANSLSSLTSLGFQQQRQWCSFQNIRHQQQRHENGSAASPSRSLARFARSVSPSPFFSSLQFFLGTCSRMVYVCSTKGTVLVKKKMQLWRKAELLQQKELFICLVMVSATPLCARVKSCLDVCLRVSVESTL